MEIEHKYQFSDGWALIAYENDIVTVTDDMGLFVKFKYPKECLNNQNIDEVLSLLSLTVGCIISKIDAIRMIHKHLVEKMEVIEYKIAPLESEKSVNQ